MNTFEQYLYKDTKTIHYPNYINGHKAMKNLSIWLFA